MEIKMGSEIVAAIIITLMCCLGFGAYKITNKPDTPVEQFAETVLQAKGINIDFSKEDKDGNVEAKD